MRDEHETAALLRRLAELLSRSVSPAGSLFTTAPNANRLPRRSESPGAPGSISSCVGRSEAIRPCTDVWQAGECDGKDAAARHANNNLRALDMLGQGQTAVLRSMCGM